MLRDENRCLQSTQHTARKLGVATKGITKKLARRRRAKLTDLKTSDLHSKPVNMNLELDSANNKVLAITKYIVIL